MSDSETLDLSSFATLDGERAARRGYPEAIYCEGKNTTQLSRIAAHARHRADSVTLFTRADPGQAAAVLSECLTPDTSRRAGFSRGRPTRQPLPAAWWSWWPPAPRTCR